MISFTPRVEFHSARRDLKNKSRCLRLSPACRGPGSPVGEFVITHTRYIRDNKSIPPTCAPSKIYSLMEAPDAMMNTRRRQSTVISSKVRLRVFGQLNAWVEDDIDRIWNSLQVSLRSLSFASGIRVNKSTTETRSLAARACIFIAESRQVREERLTYVSHDVFTSVLFTCILCVHNLSRG